MTASAAASRHGVLPERRLYRRPDRGWFGGVADGIAEHVGLAPKVIRFAFVVLSAAGGLGVALYGSFWIVLPVDPVAGPSRLPRWLDYTAGVLAAGIAVVVVALSLPSGDLFAPALLASLGGALIWRQASDSELTRLRRISRTTLTAGPADRLGRVRAAAGVVLIVGGAAFVLAREDVTAVRDGLIAVVVAVVGLALVTGPIWMRMVIQLSDERAERIRSQERADIAAHLHDSVLQTLALIQRNADSPREVARLARGQERALRTLLYEPAAASGQLGEQLRAAAAEIEDTYAVSVEVVTVGDAPMTDRLQVVVAATREALTNAAKHSGVASVSVYAEAGADRVEVFVRDRGRGFDPDLVAGDRQGVRGSIIGRIERHGGTVRVTSSAGAGTEIEIVMPEARATS